jgi:hypothetical protein
MASLKYTKPYISDMTNFPTGIKSDKRYVFASDTKFVVFSIQSIMLIIIGGGVSPTPFLHLEFQTNELPVPYKENLAKFSCRHLASALRFVLISKTLIP